MSFVPAEIARAKTMKALGFPWRPRLGDWFLDHSGYCALIRDHSEVSRYGNNGCVFLPRWDDCRAWLGARGWGQPEVEDEGDGEIWMRVSHADGRILRVCGVSDLDCLYQIILRLLILRP